MVSLQKESDWKVKVRDWWYSIQDAQKCPDEIKRVEIEHIIREALTQRGKERSGFELDNGTIGVSASTVSLQKESEWKKRFDETFSVYKNHFPCEGGYCQMDPEEFKAFIENLLEQERKRVEDESIALSPPEYIREPMMVSAFNDGVRAVLSIINKK